ncbi:hypothetical protein GC174_06580 [bacterium]|nr:hypothetical protein [bacterium]
MVFRRNLAFSFLGSLSIFFALGVPPAMADFDSDFNKDITKGFFKSDFDFDLNKEIDKSEKSSTSESSKKVQAAQRQAQTRVEREMRTQQADFQLYLQMQKVSNYMSQWATWNHRMPSYVEQMNQVIAQLCELVPNNPYKADQIQESSGLSTDPDYRYLNQPLNQFYNGEASDGFDPSSFVPNNSYEAYGHKKIHIEFNPSLTAETVREWEESPPLSWSNPPGDITVITNDSDLIVVWGAGIDGKPIHVPGSKRIRIFVSNLLMEGEIDNY